MNKRTDTINIEMKLKIKNIYITFKNAKQLSVLYPDKECRPVGACESRMT